MSRYYTCPVCSTECHDDDFSIMGEPESGERNVCDRCIKLNIDEIIAIYLEHKVNDG